MRFILTIAMVYSFMVSYSQKLSRTEKKIIANVEQNNDESILFLEKIININSGSMNHEGVKLVGDEFMKEYQKIDFKTSWIDQSEVNRAGHFFAETSGNKGKRILLIGHLDTVFPKDGDFQKFEQREGKTYGPGANDMKGGDVVMLYALKALHEAGVLKDVQIIAAYTGDEEMAGKPISVSRKHLIDAAKRSDIALGFETASGLNYATVARRGSSGWKVEVKGVRAHSSGIFNDRIGAGANFELSRILSTFYEELSEEQYLTFNPGVMLGGTELSYDASKTKGEAFGKSNVVAQTAMASGGLRFLTNEQLASARERMSAIVANNYPQTSAEITFTDSYPAMPPTEGNSRLLEVYSQVSQSLGYPAVAAWDPGKRGAADISFVAEYVDCLAGLGVTGSGAHTPNETVDLESIEIQIKRTALFIYRLISEE